MAGKKVEIVVKDGNHYDKSCKNGAEYTSVNYMGSTYGGAFPCDTHEEVNSSIQHARKRILEEGDIPVLVDNRECSKLTRWL